MTDRNVDRASAVTVRRMDAAGRDQAQRIVTRQHYLHAPVPDRARPEAYSVSVAGLMDGAQLGCLIVSRPQATRCKGFYGSVEDVAAGWCEVTRWQVLCLARVWFAPGIQGPMPTMYTRSLLPGFRDRRNVWRSTLPSTALRRLTDVVGYDYLLARPLVFPEQPYEHRWLLSYCDTRLHKGTIYREGGWELYRTNDDGIQTWRVRLPPLSWLERQSVLDLSRHDPRALRLRARAAEPVRQLALALVDSDADATTVEVHGGRVA